MRTDHSSDSSDFLKGQKKKKKIKQHQKFGRNEPITLPEKPSLTLLHFLPNSFSTVAE